MPRNLNDLIDKTKCLSMDFCDVCGEPLSDDGYCDHCHEYYPSDDQQGPLDPANVEFL
jgi:hypothetical protein